PASPVLIRALRDDDAPTRVVAAQALRKVGQADPLIVSALQERLCDEDHEARFFAAEALASLKPDSRVVIPVLEEFLSTSGVNAEVRRRATRALERLGR